MSTIESRAGLPGAGERIVAAVRARPWAAALVALAFSLQIGTLAALPYVPLVDLPNHMARHVLEADWLAGRPLPPFYRIHWRVLPNLGADLVIPLLLQVLSPLAACKVFLSLAAMVNWLGPALYIVRTNEGREGAWLAALLFLPLTFSCHFFLGFFNFYSGFGLAFLVLLHFLRLRSRARVRAWEWALHALLVALLFLWHLSDWGLYGILAASHLLVDLVRQRRSGARLGALGRQVLGLALVCLPSLILLFVYARVGSAGAGGETHWGTVARKLKMPLSLYHGYDGVTDVLSLVAWGAAAAMLFKAARSGRRWVPHAVALATLVPLYLIIPFQLGGTSDTDTRVLPAITVCALAAAGSLSPRRVGPGLALLAACLSIRDAGIYRGMRERSDMLAAQAGAFELMPPNSRVLPLVAIPALTKKNAELHFACWAVVLRRAFVPTIFAFHDQQPLEVVGPNIPGPAAFPVIRGPDGWVLDEAAVRRDYDFVWKYDENHIRIELPASFEEVFAGGGVRLFRVRRDP